jgi:thermostable 8-oxoguanine DNA glycosylase
MEIQWQITETDVDKVRMFYNRHKDNPFVKNRINRNVKKSAPKVTKHHFWEAMISCLLTTQQRSGPDSAVTRFICTNPFPLNFTLCSTQTNLKEFVSNTITKFGGLRRANKIAEAVSDNLEWLENGGWQSMFSMVDSLENNEIVGLERQSAEYINDNLKGFGPKQARNLLQSLGLTRYEIPVDSRIIKWLNDFGFPIKLSSGSLTDKNYYSFIQDGIQQLCQRSKIYPCVLDAAIFSSFDREWPEDNLVW